MKTETPLIVYFHGWKSNYQSDKIKSLSEKYDVVAPSIPSEYHEALATIIRCIEEHREDWDRMILVGTSLGGYWANLISNLYGLPAILINPSCIPSDTIGVDYPNLSATNVSPKIVLLARDDDVIDPTIADTMLREYSQIVWFDEGGHRFNRVDIISKYIDELFNQSINFT